MGNRVLFTGILYQVLPYDCALLPLSVKAAVGAHATVQTGAQETVETGAQEEVWLWEIV